MKKVFSFCTALIVLVALFCGYAKADSSNQFTQKFLKTYFTISDYSKVSDKDVLKFENLYMSNYSKPIKNLMTAQAYKADLNNRLHMSLVIAAASSKFSTKVDKIKITKTETNKDGSVFYEYNANLNFTVAGKKQIQKFSGQVTVKKINKVWKVTTNWFSSDILKLIQKYTIQSAKASS